MPWRRLLLRRRYGSIFFNISCQRADCSASTGAMNSRFQKTLHPYQTTLLHKFKKSSVFYSNFACSHNLRRRLSTLQGPSFGSSSPLQQISKSCGHLPSQALMDNVVTNQSGIKSSPTLPGDMTEVVLPTLHHYSGFLQMHLPKQKEEEDNNTYAIVILNHELPLVTLFLWHKACCRICADGGANRIYDWIPTLLPHEDPNKVRERYMPDVIKGDLDSIRPEVKEFYSGLGTKVLDNSEDQDTTDLHKCVAYAVDSMQDIKKGYVKLLVLGALGGRLDHEFANLNALYLFRGVRIVLLNDESMAFLLPKGYKNEIIIDSSVEGPYCGLLPLGGPSVATTTTGLKWDLNKTPLGFGGLISTSNMPVSNRVIVSSDTDLVWTMSIQHLHSQLKELANRINKVSF